MSTLTLRDGTSLYYKDWGSGQPVLFSHGWPLDADMWDAQMLFLAARGFRTVAFDRRGFGRSSQPWNGYDYDTFADDIAELVEQRELDQVALVGFSMGGGDVVRYITRRGRQRVSKLALLGAVTPILGRAGDFPQGVDKSVFDGMRAGLEADRAQFLDDFAVAFYGSNRPGSKVSQGVLKQTLAMALLASIKGTIDCVTAFAETDFRPDMAHLDMPTLIVHGDDDQIVPIDTTAREAAKMVRHATLKVYEGAPHALASTHKDRLNADLLAFLQQP